MTDDLRRKILRFNALYLGVAAVMGLFGLDLRAIVLGTGPQAPILAAAPDAAVGFLEAHGLALILATALWRAPATRAWHFTGAAQGALLGTCNLVYWSIFTSTNSLTLGYVTTTLHLSVAIAQLAAGIAASDVEARRPVGHVTTG